MNKKDVMLNSDTVFKTVFKSKEELIRLLKETLNIEAKSIKIIDNEMPVNKINEKRKILDLIAETDDEIINIEVNNFYKPGTYKRNLLYFCKLLGSITEKGEDYLDTPSCIQLNLTWNLNQYACKDIKNEKKLEYELLEKNGEKRLDYNFKIVTCNMDYYVDKWYNKDIENECPFMMMLAAMSLEQMETIVKGDKVMEKIYNKVKELNLDADFLNSIAIENDEEKFYNSAIKQGYRDGLKQGIEKGIEKGIEQGIQQGSMQEKRTIAEKLLDNGMTISEVSSITGLSIDELKELKG